MRATAAGWIGLRCITGNELAPCLSLPRSNSQLRATSVHPMENGTRTHPMNPEILVGRCLFLQNHGFNVTVNVVLWPEQVYLIAAWAEIFAPMA